MCQAQRSPLTYRARCDILHSLEVAIMVKKFCFILLVYFSSAVLALPLNQIKLPPGFHISIYASNIPGARQITLGKDGIVYVGTRGEGKVYALVPNKNMTTADKVITIAKGLNEPNGVAFYDGDLYVGEIQRILRYSNITNHLKHPSQPEIIYNKLPSKRWHGYRYIKFGPDNWLYIGIGMPCNTCDYRKTNPIFGTIIRMRPDGKDMQIVANGIRNTVGFAWNPVTKVLWFTDNGQDWMGDNLPPDEINRALYKGMDFGFPFFYGDNIPSPNYKKDNISSKDMTSPAWELPAHVAALGMTFYTGKQFPKQYYHQLFVTEHGSWNRSQKIGYQIVMITIKNGNAIAEKRFASGWLKGEKTWGRPVDVLVMPDGALLVSDDYAGVVYRIYVTI